MKLTKRDIATARMAIASAIDVEKTSIDCRTPRSWVGKITNMTPDDLASIRRSKNTITRLRRLDAKLTKGQK